MSEVVECANCTIGGLSIRGGRFFVTPETRR